MHRAAFAACALVLSASACDPSSVDPTESAFGVYVANAMGMPVTLVQCKDAHCHDLGDSFSLAANGSVTVAAAADATNAYVIEASHRRLGCLVLTYSAKPQKSPLVTLRHPAACP